MEVSVFYERGLLKTIYIIIIQIHGLEEIMNLTSEQKDDFAQKLILLVKYAESLGLTISGHDTRRRKTPLPESSPEEIRISGVRNLTRAGVSSEEYECRIIYNQK